MLGAQGANCSGGTININGTIFTCNGGITLPAPINGGYCFYSSAGLGSGWLSLWGSPPDGGACSSASDAGVDAGKDSGIDSGIDAGKDSGID